MTEIEELRAEVARLREEVAGLRARGEVHHHYYHEARPVLAPLAQPWPGPSLPHYDPRLPVPVTCGGFGFGTVAYNAENVWPHIKVDYADPRMTAAADQTPTGEWRN